jgi:hypothetical protein
MSKSGLIAVLPLVAASLVGAIIGAVANGLYRDWQDKKAQKRERNGLLMLIYYEVNFNDSGLKSATPYPTKIIADTLRTDAWDKAQAKLAQELPIDYVQQLAHYYGQIMLLKAWSSVEDTEFAADARQTVQIALESGKMIMRRAQT